MRLALLYLTLFGLSFAQESKPYPIDVERNGNVYHQIATPFWASEYPSPVININAHAKGFTTIEGYPSLRTKKDSKPCEVKNGLYHPWAKEPNSLIGFYTINPVKIDMRVGDKILYVSYAAEGYSHGIFSPSQSQEVTVEFLSTVFEDNPQIFKRINQSPALPNPEQWLYLQCTQGYNVFVQDSDLLMQQGIKKGQITGYGDISI
ncbi:MAG: hypothetical protein KU38_03565 [Sulfurovum sp. FS08-3]|nr:MAG: hypothetical protein KU38_03565 [Sulfurovum sp. FS08-3]